LKIKGIFFHQTILFFIFLLSATYVLKQTNIEIVFKHLVLGFEFTAFIFFIFLFIYKPIKIDNYLSKFIRFTGVTAIVNSIFFMLSYLIINFFFLIPYALNFVFKILLCYLFIFINYHFGSSAIKKIADGILLASLFVVLGSILHFIDSNYVINPNWIKFDGGFLNPNIGPFFFFSALIIYYLIYSEIMFYLTFFLILILAYYFNFYSRTFIIGTVLLFFFRMYENFFFLYFQKINKALFISLISYFSLFSLSVIVFSLSSSFDHFRLNEFLSDSIHPTSPFHTYNYETIFSTFLYKFNQFKEYVRYSLINNFLSNRLGQIFDGLLSLNPNIFRPFDSIFYEFLTLWLFCFAIIYSQIKNIFFVKLNDRKLIRIRLACILFFFLGVFEGFITKLGFPLLFFLMLFLFDLHHLPKFFGCNKRIIF